MSINQTKLKNYFPTIRAKSEILDTIRNSQALSTTFNKWTTDQQEQFLDICSGNRGVKMLYDVFFKDILNPETTPGRLSNLLSCLLEQKVTVKKQLPNDTIRIADETSLVITDIVVELDDGSLANVEVQKIGYLFLGERASCYSADMLLRQYKRVRDERNEKFSYKDISPVYTIVFMENSPEIFHKFANTYVHKFGNRSDTGLELNFLQKFIFVPVDIFLSKLHNSGISSKLDAWFTFLGCDEIEYIEKLITDYPEFIPIYSQLYEMCRDVEEVMKMFSKELEILDRNTVRLMIDEFQERVDKLTKENEDKDVEIENKNSEIENKDTEIKNKDSEIAEKNKRIAELEAKLADIENKNSKGN